MTGRYYIDAGTSYIQAITSIINSSGIWKIPITPNSSVIGTENNYVKRRAYEHRSSIYNTITFNTPNMPHHTFEDCIWFEDKSMGIANKFIETSWQMELNAGGKMSHRIRRVVDI